MELFTLLQSKKQMEKMKNVEALKKIATIEQAVSQVIEQSCDKFAANIESIVKAITEACKDKTEDEHWEGVPDKYKLWQQRV